MQKRIAFFSLFLLMIFMIIPVNFVSACHNSQHCPGFEDVTITVTTTKSTYEQGDIIFVSATITKPTTLDIGFFILAPGGDLEIVAEKYVVNNIKSSSISTSFEVDSNFKETGSYRVLVGQTDQYGRIIPQGATATAAISIQATTSPTVEQQTQQQPQQTQQSQGGGCLIATASFGSEMAPQVQFLRELRDNTVLQTESGTSFMAGFNQFYYSFSPAVADYERENPVFKEAVKLTLTPLLTSLTLLQYTDIDSESEMLGYGIGVILLNIGMYFVAPAVLIMAVKKKI